jgi:transcriptional regulator with XRE-family HTH domain
VGYGGKVVEQVAARELRAGGMTVPDIAAELGVSKSSVSLWVRDVPVPPMARRQTRSQTPHPHKLRRLAEIEEMDRRGLERLGALDEQAFLAAGAALYAGEGAKGEGVVFANTDPALLDLHMRWIRHFFEIDEQRLRGSLYLHRGLDVAAATDFWSHRLGIPVAQFIRPQIVEPVATKKKSKHLNGCMTVRYSCARTHREVMGVVRALLSSEALPG